MFEPKPLWYRIVRALYGVCVIAWPVVTVALLGYAIWKWNSGLLAIGLASALLLAITIFLIREER
jgi:hypothetical protein